MRIIQLELFVLCKRCRELVAVDTSRFPVIDPENFLCDECFDFEYPDHNWSLRDVYGEFMSDKERIEEIERPDVVDLADFYKSPEQISWRERQRRNKEYLKREEEEWKRRQTNQDDDIPF